MHEIAFHSPFKKRHSRLKYSTILKIIWINGGWTQPMLRELNQSGCLAPKSRPRKFRNFKKVPPRQQGLSGGHFLPGTLFSSWFLRWKHTKYQAKVPSSWVKFLRWKRGTRCTEEFKPLLTDTHSDSNQINLQLNITTHFNLFALK